jgi:hypothetical protein
MHEDEERRPEDRRADGEMVVEVPGARAEEGLGLAKGIEAFLAKGLVGRLIVVAEVEIVLDQRGAGVSVIADTITPNPRIHEGKSKKKKDDENPFERLRLGVPVSVRRPDNIRISRRMVTQNYSFPPQCEPSRVPQALDREDTVTRTFLLRPLRIVSFSISYDCEFPFPRGGHCS